MCCAFLWQVCYALCDRCFVPCVTGVQYGDDSKRASVDQGPEGSISGGRQSVGGIRKRRQRHDKGQCCGCGIPVTGCQCDHCCRHPGNGTVVTVVWSGDKLARCLGLRVVRQELDGVLSVRLYSSGNLCLCLCSPPPPPPPPSHTHTLPSPPNRHPPSSIIIMVSVTSRGGRPTRRWYRRMADCMDMKRKGPGSFISFTDEALARVVNISPRVSQYLVEAGTWRFSRTLLFYQRTDARTVAVRGNRASGIRVLARN